MTVQPNFTDLWTLPVEFRLYDRVAQKNPGLDTIFIITYKLTQPGKFKNATASVRVTFVC